jgi:hypothetical protein
MPLNGRRRCTLNAAETKTQTVNAAEMQGTDNAAEIETQIFL